MIQTAAQLKGRIKNMSNKDARRAESLMRLYFMERFLERVSVSDYREKFVLKGGMLTASLLGIDMRTTMDIDTTVKALPLTEQDISKTIGEICGIDLGDNVTFEIKYTETIMDDFEYPGVRLQIDGRFEGLRQAIKIDVSTDDVITPGAIEYEYKLTFEERTIQLISYNTETLLAEKLQTILSRGIANTRLRDFYDVYMIISNREFSWEVLSAAFKATCEKRSTVFTGEKAEDQMKLIAADGSMEEKWDKFKRRSPFADAIMWSEVLYTLKECIIKIVIDKENTDTKE